MWACEKNKGDITISPWASNNIESYPRAIDSANTRAICLSRSLRAGTRFQVVLNRIRGFEILENLLAVKVI